MAGSSFCSRVWVCGALAGMGAIIAFPTSTSAQVVADPSIGTIVTSNGTTFQITGGTIAGNRNLFHSFSRFDVPTAGVASFLNSPNIVNIFSRVTGGTPSQIDGIVRSAGTANLFLMNPSGIIFGQNARLDVGGSFVATTANTIQFGDRGVFSASISEPPSQLLTINPSAFWFNQINIAPIQSNSQNLGVGDEKSLLLLGGNVTLDNSFLGVASIVGGRAELAGLAAPGEVGLTVNNGIFRLSFPSDVLRSDVTLKNGSRVDVIAGGGGSIAVHARNLSVLNQSSLVAGIGAGLGLPTSRAGDITLDAVGIIEVNQAGFIENNVYRNGIGNSGNIYITSGSLLINGGSDLGTFVLGEGKAGDVVINTLGRVAIEGTSPDGQSSSGIFSQVNSGAVGQGGNIRITTDALSLANSTLVRASLFGKGNAGNIDIQASDKITLDNDSFIASNVQSSNAVGNGGNVTLRTGSIFVRGGSQINAFTRGRGDAGNLTIQAQDTILFEDVGSSGLLSGAQTDVAIGGRGKAGDLTIYTKDLFIRNGAQVTASVSGLGNAGKLVINASGSVELSGEAPSQGGNRGFPGGLFAQVEPTGMGQGGSIFIETPRLSVSDGSKIQVATFGDGNAGDLFIRADEINVLDTSKLNFYSTTINAGVSRDPFSTVTPTSGNGGNLTIKARHLNILGGGAEVAADTRGIGNAGDLTIDTERLVVRDGGQVSASTFSFGSAGTLVIHASEFVELSGDSGEDGAPGGILAQVNQNGRGRGGNLVLETKRLSISDGSKIQVATFGDGDAGNLFIRAGEIDLFDTPNATNFFSTAINAGVTRDPRFTRQPMGNGGSLTIETGRLSIRNGAELTVDTSGQGNAGSLLVKATDLVEVVGQNSFLTADVNSRATGKGGSLTIETRRLSIRDGGQVGSSTFGIGNAGDVFVRATDIDIIGAAANGNPSGLFSTSSQDARGNGGNLLVDAENLNLSHSGRLSAQSRGTGTGGNITVNARNIRMRSNSDILTISNSGDGGNITLNAQTIVALENSDILAFAPAGRGGNITFNTRAFLSDPLYRPSPSITDRATLFAILSNDRVDVNASGTVSGTVNGVPDITFLQNGLTQLSDNLIDPNTLLANSCIVRNREQNGSFKITGSGGLPYRPGDAPIASFPTGEVRSLPTTQSQSARPWQLGDEIVEPQGIYRLPNGKLVMSRECQTQ